MSTPHMSENGAFNALLRRLPPEVATSFSPRQTQALKQALQSQAASRHPVDLRLSIPCWPRRLYLVLLIGQERRPMERLKQCDRTLVISHRQVGLMLGCLLLGVGSVFALSQAPSWIKAVQERPVNIHSTSLPFKTTEEECREMDRVWEDDKCFDPLHDPNF